MRVINVCDLFAHTKIYVHICTYVYIYVHTSLYVFFFQWYPHWDVAIYVRCSASHIISEKKLFKCFIHLSLFYIIILNYFILPFQQFNAMYLFCFSLMPPFLLLTLFKGVWHFKKPFQSSASWLHPFGYLTKITFLQTFYWIYHKSRTSEHNILCGRQETSKQACQCLTCMCIIPKHLEVRIEFVFCEKSLCGWAEGQTAWLIRAHTEVRVLPGISLSAPS